MGMRIRCRLSVLSLVRCSQGFLVAIPGLISLQSLRSDQKTLEQRVKPEIMVVVKSNIRYYFHITLTLWTSLTCFVTIIVGTYITYQYNKTGLQLIPSIFIVSPYFLAAGIYLTADVFPLGLNVHSRRASAQSLAFRK